MDAFGGSAGLLDKMLENDMGSEVLTGFDSGSSLTPAVRCGKASSLTTLPGFGVSQELCMSCGRAGLVSDRTGDSNTLAAGDSGMELCLLGGCACELA